MTALLWIGLTLLAAVVSAEFAGWSSWFASWVLRRAAAALPPASQERYRAEWAAELANVPDGPITRAVWVFSIWRHRRNLARTLTDDAGPPQWLGALSSLRPTRAAFPDNSADYDWMERAACASLDPELFFPEVGDDFVADAQRVCQSCPVRMECLVSAVVNKERYGIWGGFTTAQRDRLTAP